MVYLNARQAAELIGISLSTLHVWRNEGMFPPPTRLGRSVRWTRTDIDEFMAAHKAAK